MRKRGLPWLVSRVLTLRQPRRRKITCALAISTDLPLTTACQVISRWPGRGAMNEPVTPPCETIQGTDGMLRGSAHSGSLFLWLLTGWIIAGIAGLAIAEPAALVAVTDANRLLGRSALVTVYVGLVAPGIGLQGANWKWPGLPGEGMSKHTFHW